MDMVIWGMKYSQKRLRRDLLIGWVLVLLGVLTWQFWGETSIAQFKGPILIFWWAYYSNKFIFLMELEE